MFGAFVVRVGIEQSGELALPLLVPHCDVTCGGGPPSYGFWSRTKLRLVSSAPRTSRARRLGRRR
eukprot:3423237-Prymnesium_polylepis.1